MGIKFMAMAIDAKTANSGQKLVLLMLANHCNDHTRQCNPSQKLLAEECSMGLSTLKNHLSALEEAGYLEAINVYKDNIQRPNQYLLKLSSSQYLATPPSGSGYPPSQNLATEPEVKTRREKATEVAAPDGVSPEIWEAFVKHRKTKKAPVTDLVMSGIAEQAKLADWTMENALKEICVRGWSSFKAEWVVKKPGFVKPLTAGERAANVALGRPADYRVPTPEEQAAQEKARLFR